MTYWPGELNCKSYSGENAHGIGDVFLQDVVRVGFRGCLAAEEALSLMPTCVRSLPRDYSPNSNPVSQIKPYAHGVSVVFRLFGWLLSSKVDGGGRNSGCGCINQMRAIGNRISPLVALRWVTRRISSFINLSRGDSR